MDQRSFLVSVDSGPVLEGVGTGIMRFLGGWVPSGFPDGEKRLASQGVFLLGGYPKLPLTYRCILRFLPPPQFFLYC